VAYLVEQDNGKILLTLYVQPRASRNRIAGLHGDAVKLCVTAPPVDDKANGAVIAFLAKFFNIPKSAVVIQSGKQSRTKRLILSGLSLVKAQGVLHAFLERG